MFYISDGISEKIADEFRNSYLRHLENRAGSGSSDIARRKNQLLANLRKSRSKQKPPAVVSAAPKPDAIMGPVPVLMIDPNQIPAGELLEVVAQHLSGRAARVEYGIIPTSGQCEYLADGSVRITIHENLTGAASRFNCFLHEAAHALWDSPRAPDGLDLHKHIEYRAERQAKIWAEYAESRWRGFGADTEAEHVRKLRALLRYVGRR